MVQYCKKNISSIHLLCKLSCFPVICIIHCGQCGQLGGGRSKQRLRREWWRARERDSRTNASIRGFSTGSYHDPVDMSVI